MPAVMVDVDHGVVRAAGDLDIQSAPQVRQALQRAASATDDAVVVDMSGVTFMDSTGLRELLRATSERPLVLRDVPEGVRSLLGLAGVESLFTIE